MICGLKTKFAESVAICLTCFPGMETILGIIGGTTMLKNRLACPKCKNKNYAEILWGIPADMGELKEALANKEIVLDGCIVTGNDPRWKCNVCNNRWGERFDDE